MSSINQITKRKFDAYCYFKKSWHELILNEIDWYETTNPHLLGTVIYDLPDNDFGYIILGRDEKRLYRYLTAEHSYITQEAATLALKKAFYLIQEENKSETFNQYDEIIPAHDVMNLIVKSEKIHPYFRMLMDYPRYEGAKKLIREIAYSFEDLDGNYKQQFQTNGFNQRLWELYLHAFFYSIGCDTIASSNIPDFSLKIGENEFFVEATSVNPSDKFDEPNPASVEDMKELLNDYMCIKWASSLSSKMKKKYWELPHVKNKQFIIAIHDYHQSADTEMNQGSMTWSGSALFRYLYGLDERGQTINSHKYKTKEIPSGFFKLPESEYVSAILYSNGATLSKFNRMGKIADLGSENTNLIRSGVRLNKYGEMVMFLENIEDPGYEEKWSDEILIYHNPFAKIPLNPCLIPEVSHISYDYSKNEIKSLINERTVINSITITQLNMD